MSSEELKKKLLSIKENKNEELSSKEKGIVDAILALFDEIKRLKDENFRLDYQNTRIKGALFEFEMNYYEDNLKGKKKK